MMRFFKLKIRLNTRITCFCVFALRWEVTGESEERRVLWEGKQTKHLYNSFWNEVVLWKNYHKIVFSFADSDKKGKE